MAVEPLTAPMGNSDMKVPFGHRGNELVGPGDVAENGLACGCVCPGCGATLLTRQGSRRRHFAHYNSPGSPLCVERAIHTAAIHVLLKARRLAVPALVVHVENTAASGIPVVRSSELQAQEIIFFNACEDEVTFSSTGAGTIRIDVVGYYGAKTLLIEIRFTHAVDADKLAKVVQHGHAMIEIDVSSLRFDDKLASLKKCVLDDLENKQWLYHPASASTVQRLTEQVDTEITARDQEYAQKRVEWDRAQAERAAKAALSRQLKQKQIDEAEAKKEAALTARVKAYRNKPVQEKEVDILRWLGVDGPWPEHMRVDHPKNRAFPAPFRLWQAALFHQFIFQKSPRHKIESRRVADWVKQWFGDSSSGGYTCYNGVTAYLEYLSTRGCLDYLDRRYGHASFAIVSNKLHPPLLSQKARRSSSFDLPSPHVIERDLRPFELRWKANWPGYTQVRTAITKRRDCSNAEELRLLYVLFQCRQDLPLPAEFAEMVQHDFLSIQVLVFMRGFGFTEEVRGGCGHVD